jgi:hypothetical protein
MTTSQKTAWTDLPLKVACALSAMAMTTAPSLAAINQSDYGTMFGDDYNSKAELSTDSTSDTVQSIYGLLKVVLVVAGLFIFAGGIFQIIKAHKSQGQISPSIGWMMIFGGATLSVAGAIFFALGSGIKGSLVSSG